MWTNSATTDESALPHIPCRTDALSPSSRQDVRRGSLPDIPSNSVRRQRWSTVLPALWLHEGLSLGRDADPLEVRRLPRLRAEILGHVWHPVPFTETADPRLPARDRAVRERRQRYRGTAAIARSQYPFQVGVRLAPQAARGDGLRGSRCRSAWRAGPGR